MGENETFERCFGGAVVVDVEEVSGKRGSRVEVEVASERRCMYGLGPVRRRVEGERGWKVRVVMGREGTWIVERRGFEEPSI